MRGGAGGGSHLSEDGNGLGLGPLATFWGGWVLPGRASHRQMPAAPLGGQAPRAQAALPSSGPDPSFHCVGTATFKALMIKHTVKNSSASHC